MYRKNNGLKLTKSIIQKKKKTHQIIDYITEATSGSEIRSKKRLI